MDSRVLIHYVPSDGHVWAEYLYQKLKSKDIAINCEPLEFSAKSVYEAQFSILNVFFVTPDFLDVQTWNWTSGVDKNKCILVLTGTESEDLELSAQEHKCESVLDFFVYQLTETEASVRDLLVFIIAKYEESDLPRHGSLPTPDPHRPGSLPTPQPHRHGSLPTPHHFSTPPKTEEDEPLHHTDSEPRQFKYMYSNHPIGMSEQFGRAGPGGNDSTYSPKLSRSYIQEEIDSDYDFLPTMQRQVNGVHDVLYKNGKLYLLLWRRAEGTLKVKLQDHEISPACTECALYEMPYDGKHSAKMSVIQDGTQIGETTVQFPDSPNTEHVVIQSAQLPQTAQTQTDASVQTSCVSVSTQTDDSERQEGRSIISSVHEEESQTRDSLYVNIDDVFRERPASEEIPGYNREKRLDYIRKILEDETDPEELLCQCLGIDKSIRHLDEKMTSMVQNVETLRHLSFSGSRSVSEDEERAVWPTLVHFGAQFNLISFCEVLLTNPLMYGACVRKNRDGHMPHDIARNHGHHELAEMLKHFSEFVRAEKERDSGIYGFSTTPRLSTISSDAPPPPRPHRPTHSGQHYINMEHGQQRQSYERDSFQKPRQISKLSKDGGFVGSFESDSDYMPMSQAMFKGSFWNSSQTTLCSSTSSQTLHDSAEVDPEISTLNGSDVESDTETEHQRKDVSNMLGMMQAPSVSPNEESKSKKSKLRKLFFRNKGRSNSEPSVFSSELLGASRNTTGKAHHRDSARSSSSTASTYSDSSHREDDGPEVQMRGEKKHSGKKKIKGFLKSAKKRQSIRIKQVMECPEIKVPALPSKACAEVF